MPSYRLYPSTNGPATAVSYAGNFTAGVVFEVTGDGCWFEGYWWWVASNGPTTAQKFALWLMTDPGVGVLIPAATITSGTLAAGWNYVPLPSPVPLSVGGPQAVGGACYVAATGVNGNFPDTNGYFTANGPAAAGIKNGPLVAYSDQSGSNPGPFATYQGVFGTAGPDPTAEMPSAGFQSANFWMDLQVSDTAPAGYTGSYRLWPNFFNPTNGIQLSNDAGTQTMGTIFSLSQPCQLDNVWLYSPAGVGGLPASTQIWNTATESLVPGTGLTAAWSGPAGSGWIANSYGALDIVLPAGLYIATVFNNSGKTFYTETQGYFGSFGGVTGPGASGLTNGPLSAPSNAHSPNPPGGNSCYFTGGTVPTYPNAWDDDDGGETRWVDVEVTPASSTVGSGPGTVNSGAFLAFFP
jgi:hypothetical protein